MGNGNTFKEIYRKYIVTDNFNEEKVYYRRHEYRYRYLMNIYSKLRKGHSDVLDIGGGQYGLLVQKMYGDCATVADIENPKIFSYLQGNGVVTCSWDMCEQFLTLAINRFDFIFFSEVLEHLPVPAYTIFKVLKRALKPGGIIICTVPNLTSLENIFSFIFNIPVFAYFKEPFLDEDAGHVIMYTKEHLAWQIEKAGFKQADVKYKISMKYHKSILRNILFCVGFPLFIIPHFRTEILAIIKEETNGAK